MSRVSVTIHVADRVKTLRAERRWSAQRLADECARAGMKSLSRSTIAKIEAGVRKSITVDELAVLSEVLGVTTDNLVASDSTSSSSLTSVARDAAQRGDGGAMVSARRESALPSMMDVESPFSLSNLPYLPRFFVGRADIGAWVTDAFEGVSNVVAVAAVNGLGGVGKSTFAAWWAHRHAESFNPIWWIRADSVSNIDTDLARLASTLEPGISLSLDALRSRAMQWLASHDGWLLILDDVSNWADIAPLIAQSGNGRILITTRLSVAWPNAKTIRMDTLTLEEATTLLREIASIPDASYNQQDIDSLCLVLGNLPLAIAQAGAYIAETRITPARYLRLLEQYTASMLTETSEASHYGHTMAQVWRITLDRIGLTPLARQLIRILAWYAPDSIPRTLTRGISDEPKVLTAIGRLSAYSMLIVEEKTLRVHPLVQKVFRTADVEDPHRQPEDVSVAHGLAVDLLLIALDGLNYREPSHWPFYRELVPHAIALLEYTPPDKETEATSLLMHNVGVFLRTQGMLESAVTYLERAASFAERILGPYHVKTLAIRNDLARTHADAWSLDLAITQLESTLQDRIRVLGADDPSALESRNELAQAYAKIGHLDRAIALFESTLSDQLRVLGPDHPDTLTTRHNLARWRGEAGDPVGAIAAFEQLLSDQLRVLGPDHPDTLTTRHNLARWRGEAGDPVGAIAAFEQLLSDQLRVLGPDHPDTLTTRHNLAYSRGEAGDPVGAIAAFEQLLSDQLRVLGPDHPDTLTTRHNLADADRGGESADFPSSRPHAVRIEVSHDEMDDQLIVSDRPSYCTEHPGKSSDPAHLTNQERVNEIVSMLVSYRKKGMFQEARQIFDSVSLDGPEIQLERARLHLTVGEVGQALQIAERLAGVSVGISRRQRLEAIGIRAEAYLSQDVAVFNPISGGDEDAVQSLLWERDQLKQRLGDRDISVLVADLRCAHVWVTRGRPAQCLRDLRGVAAAVEEIVGVSSRLYYWVRHSEAQAHAQLKEYDQVVRILEPLLQMQLEGDGPYAPNTVTTLIDLGIALALIGRKDEGKELVVEAERRVAEKFNWRAELRTRAAVARSLMNLPQGLWRLFSHLDLASGKR